MSATLGGGVGRRLSRHFDDESRGLDRFGVVLALTVASVVELGLVDLGGDGGTGSTTSREVASLAAAVLVGSTLAFALRASGLSQRRQRFFDLLVLVVILGYLVTILVEAVNGPLPGPVAGMSGVIVLLSLFAPGVVVLRLLRHRAVTSATLLGAVAAFLLIGLAYYWVFLAVNEWQPHFFSQGPQPTTSYMYFSLTSLTTVGYGDLTAVHPLGRLLANSEAVIGQVYLVTFVAMIVGLRAQAWRDAREAERSGRGDASPE